MTDEAPRDADEEGLDDEEVSDESAFEELVDEINDDSDAPEEASESTRGDVADEDDSESSVYDSFEDITSTAELDLGSDDRDPIPESETGSDADEFAAFTPPEVADDDRDTAEAETESSGEGASAVDEADFVDPDDPPRGSESAFGDLLDRLADDEADSPSVDEVAHKSTGRRTQLERVGALDANAKTLLLARSGSDDEHEACTSFLTHSPPEETNVLLVWLSRSPTKRFDRLLEEWDERPERLGVVALPETFSETTEGMVWDADSFSLNTISDPADLTQVGITISQAIAEWDESSHLTTVCVDSISDLLRHNDTERVFRFLHVLEGRLDSVDATAHFHLDNRNHELQTIRTMQSLFDRTLEVNEDGITQIE